MLHATTTTVQYLRTDICLHSEFWGPQNTVDIDVKNSIWMFYDMLTINHTNSITFSYILCFHLKCHNTLID